jgi:zinc/manganese transport system substrate-binding protein
MKMKPLLMLLLLPLSLFAHLNIVVSYPYIGAITKAIGKDHVDTIVLAQGNWDPHFIVPRPSLISKLRSADALIMNGGQLEIGWLPPLIKRANNPKTIPSAPTFLDLSRHISFLQKPKSLDRAQGDVHPDGNPHFHLNPNNILILAQTIATFLSSIDSEHQAIYATNLKQFEQDWRAHLTQWQKNMASKKGMKVIQFHDNLAYFNQAYGLENIGTLEPLPGIPPSSRHTMEIIERIKRQKPYCIFHDVYHSTKTAQYISDKTGIPVILMPHDIGALESIDSLVALFDYLTTVQAK